MPRPTVNPILVLINCSAVSNPLKYDALEPEAWSETKLNKPPFPRPEGSWKRMPVICWVLINQDKNEEQEGRKKRILTITTNAFPSKNLPYRFDTNPTANAPTAEEISL